MSLTPVVHHDPRPDRRVSSRPRRRVRAALGDRKRVRRAQNPPARHPHGAAVEITRSGPARGLGSSVLSLRHRTLMWEAAHDAGVDPDRVSFVAALRIARRSISAARDFSPSAHRPWLAPRHRPALPASQPDPSPSQQPSAHQTKDAQMARQTSPTPQLATTNRTTHRHHHSVQLNGIAAKRPSAPTRQRAGHVAQPDRVPGEVQAKPAVRCSPSRDGCLGFLGDNDKPQLIVNP